MEYAILAGIFLLMVILLERAVSKVEVYKPAKTKDRKYHTYSNADIEILNNDGISNELASEFIGVSVNAIKHKRRRISEDNRLDK